MEFRRIRSRWGKQDAVREDRHPTHNGAGWVLDVRRFAVSSRFRRDLKPLLLIPGYCMNSFVLGFHPEGLSLVEHLAYEGFEVWTANLRGQGESRRIGGAKAHAFRELALVDLPRAIDVVLQETRTRADVVDLIGISLGGTFVYTYLAHRTECHRVGSVVGMGAPLRWERIHPAIKLAFRSRRLVGALPIKGTRRMAKLAVPVVRRLPKIASLYVNPRNVDLTPAGELVKTVEDPVPALNRAIAQWMQDVDLHVDGVNVTDGLQAIDRPLLCVYANGDGIVPPAVALSVTRRIGSRKVETLEVGDDRMPYAHADMFIGTNARQTVFKPLSSWLERHNPSA